MTQPKNEQWLTWGKQVLSIEATSIQQLASELSTSFSEAIQLLTQVKGRIVVSGMGKSGHIGRKIAATFASTGNPAFFLHPAEALHGDLGMVTANDVIIVLSHSGESNELLAILPQLKRLAVPIISITGNPNSTLAKMATVHLCNAVSQEACPLGLAPTASTTVSLALGDALAMTLLQEHGFSTEDFARSHPGGSLGKRLLTRVQDIMRPRHTLAHVLPDATVLDALNAISKHGMGMTLVIDNADHVQGVFTDGDFRRAAAQHPHDVLNSAVSHFMSKHPRTIPADSLATAAVECMERHRVTQLLVTDERDFIVGALHMHDLLQHKLA